jgi:hypothetical protein
MRLNDIERMMATSRPPAHNRLHPTAGTLLLNFLQPLVAAGNVGR